MAVNSKIDKHLRYWQEECSISTFKNWCHTEGKNTDHKNFIVDLITLKKPLSVLDVGCGTAHLGEKLMAQDYKGEYTGTEITKKFVDYNRLNGYNCIEADIYNLPFEENSFEYVVSLDVLNHQKSFQQPLFELIRVAKKTVIVSFFKDFENSSRIVSKTENLIFHHFNLQEIEDYLTSLDVSYEKINFPNLSVRPKLIVIIKNGDKK